MSKALYLIGAPGTGKSTVMDEIVRQMGLTWAPDEKVWRELWVNPLLDGQGATKGISLGVHRDAFSGTDALSMSVQPRAVEWLEQTTLPEYVLGEGMRLSAPKFLLQLDYYAPTTIVHLEAAQDVLDRRVAARGHDLKPQFRRTAETRARNAARALEDLGFDVLTYRTDTSTPSLIADNVLKIWLD